MSVGQIVPGQRAMWKLAEKLGEGDAGEVFLIESTLQGKQAILKRPRKGAYSSDILRQAAQIRSEGSILRALSEVSFSSQVVHLSTPAVLDESRPEDGGGERYFIIIERASGIDLKSLRQISHFGVLESIQSLAGEENRFFIEKIARFGQIPEPILIRILGGVIHLLETIHSSQVSMDSTAHAGLIWNDVKPEHLFWDPHQTRLTVIDWGNGQFLEADGATKDRRYTRNDDYSQFIQEIGGFLAESNPSLHKRLEWPKSITPGSAYSDGVKPLKKRLAALQKEFSNQLKKLRIQESTLHSTSQPDESHISQSEDIQQQIVAYGEMPHIADAINLHARYLLHLASENNLETFRQVCGSTAELAATSADKWSLLGEIARIALEQSTNQNEQAKGSFSKALAMGVADDWPGALWQLFEHNGKEPLPSWWDKLSQEVRRVYLKLEPDALTPYTEVSRLFFTLQATIQQMGDQAFRSHPDGASVSSEERLQAFENLLKIFNEEVGKKWKELEPAPPYSGIDYKEIDAFVEDIEAILPGTREKIDKFLSQPKAQADIALNAWDRKEFEIARRALRMLMIWDPDRRRLLLADRALGSAAGWLTKIRQGAGPNDPFYEYITSVELEGRRLRNLVGPSKWLDLILDALKGLRKGVKHADLIIEHPEVLNEIPWLSEYRSREILSLPGTRPLRLEREEIAPELVKTVTGVQEGKLGPNQDIHLAEPLDIWVPEARGSSARVFTGHLRNRAGQTEQYALKVMRPKRIEYALPLFREEVQVLSILRDVPGISPLVECGFLRIEEGLDFPSDETHRSAAHLEGQVVRYGAEEAQNFLASMERYIAQGWLPYLALVKRDPKHNLMVYCDAGYTHGWFLPLREGLLLAIQICDILQIAHDRNIVYRDHKILHFYWEPQPPGVVMIDWNIAKRQPEGLSEAEKQFDLVQFGARALHHIITGRPAPGALPVGPNRPEEIERSALSYTVSWTYDDERLPNRVKEILEQALNQGYTHVKALRQDLAQVQQQAPEPAQNRGKK